VNSLFHSLPYSLILYLHIFFFLSQGEGEAKTSSILVAVQQQQRKEKFLCLLTKETSNGFVAKAEFTAADGPKADSL